MIQRVTQASVTVNGISIGKINRGLVILLGIKTGDTEKDVHYLAEKCARLRIFSDEAGKFNLSCLDVNGQILVVSQFTLYGDTHKGRRPSFTTSAPPEISKPLYNLFINKLKEFGLKVEEGQFGALMQVQIFNDGPVTFIVESKGT